MATPPIPQLTANTPPRFAGAVPPTSSDTPSPASPSNASREVEQIDIAATDGQAVDVGGNPLNDVSLWDRAYDALREEEPDRVATYEQLLSRVLIRGMPSIRPKTSSIVLTQGHPVQCTSQPTANDMEDVVEITNQVPRTIRSHAEKS